MENKTRTNAGCAGERGLHSKSTATEVQHARILALLALHPCTTEELTKAGIFRAAARIGELRRMGHDILTTRIQLIDRDGFTHHGVALYSLEAA